MDEDIDGRRDNRGYWVPNKRQKRAPVFIWPFNLFDFLRWLLGYPGFLWPWNFAFFIMSFAVWFYLTPSMETARHLDVGWMSAIFLRNLIFVILFYGVFHLILFVWKNQQTQYKYNLKWPTNNSGSFLLRSQTRENIILTIFSAVPVWTLYEIAYLWLVSNSYLYKISFDQNVLLYIALFLIWPIWFSMHFYFVHRLLHYQPLYRLIHSIHHKNVNPGPWSGLSMHPIEHILYFSAVLIFFVIPSSAHHVVFGLIVSGLGPAIGHLGFDRVIIKNNNQIITENYFHYLHHKYFDINYGTGDRLVPLDEWFGTAHDGSPQSEKAMHERRRVARDK